MSRIISTMGLALLALTSLCGNAQLAPEPLSESTWGDQQEVTGKLVEARCYFAHGRRGQGAQDCGRELAYANLPLAIAKDDKSLLYLVEPQAMVVADINHRVHGLVRVSPNGQFAKVVTLSRVHIR